MKGKNKFVAIALSCLMLIGLIVPGVSEVQAAGETVTVTIEGYNDGNPIATFTADSNSWKGLNKTYTEDSPAWEGPSSAVLIDPGQALSQQESPYYDEEFAEYFYSKAEAGKSLKWYYKGTTTRFEWVETSVSSSTEIVGKWEDAVNHVVISYGNSKEKDYAVPYGKTFNEAGCTMPTDTESAKKGYELTGWVTDSGEYFDASYREDTPITGPLSVEAEYQLVDTSTADLVDFKSKYPKTITGKCTVKETGTYKGHAKFAVHGLDGALTGKTTTVYCKRPGAATPFGSIPYTAERGDISYNSDGSAQATYTISVRKSPVAAVGSAYGYQLLQGKLTVKENTGGKIEITKSSANPAITDGNACYSLTGVKFGVYKEEACENLVGTITIGENNKGSLSDLPQRTYYIRELKGFTGKHYAWNSKVYSAKVKAGNTVSVSIKNVPQNDPVTILLGKVDAETNKNKPEGSASLAGAKFVVEYYDKENIKADGTFKSLEATGVPLKEDGTGDYERQWIFETDEDGFVALRNPSQKVGGDDLYYDAAGKNPVFPIGTYVIYEKSAPKGYLVNENEYFVRNVVANAVDNPMESVSTFNAPDGDEAVKESPKRGDFEFIKVADTSLERMANVPFKVTSKTTGEYHIIVTDANGEFKSASSWSKHSNDTNINDAAYNEESNTIDESKLDPEAGLWFGEMNALDNDRGALLYDDYILEELRCEANEDYALVKFAFTVYRDQGLNSTPTSVNIGTLTDDVISISTTACEKESGSQLTYATKDITIVDTISYTGFTKGETYKFVGTLMDKETGEPVLIDGKEVTSTVEQKLRTSEGEVEVEFTFDATSLKGQDIVVFEKALDVEGNVVTTHEDITDEDQTITFADPEIGTTAIDFTTENHISYANGEVTIIDTVDYTGLIPGVEVTVSGKMMDKATGEAMLDNAGKEVVAETTFTPEEADGSAEVKFVFDASALAGTKGVVFEQLIFDKEVIASHEDIDDEDQTITFPEIGTQAVDSETGMHISYADNMITIIDTVAYKGLMPGYEYEMTGKLIDKKTGKPIVVDGKAVTAAQTFTAEEEDGEVEVTFVFDGRSLAGTSVVAYEDLLFEGHVVADHKDIQDPEQSVDIPEIKTSAEDKATGKDKLTYEEGKSITIVDTVKYTNLTAGGTYKVSGILMDKATGKALLVDGKEATVEKTFVAEKSNGKVEVEFTVPMSAVKDKTTVVFEKMYVEKPDGEFVIVGSHEDINDVDQSIQVITAVKTGDHLPLGIMLAMILLTISSLAVVFIIRQRRFA